MIGLYNRDSSFFEVTVDGIPTPTNITADIISFTYEEERGKMNSGSISMLDPQLIYTDLLKQGKSITMSWGYKQRPIFLSVPIDTTEMWGEYRRKNVKAITQFPSGNATENGVITFNCNFISSEYMKGQKNTIYKQGRKADVIQLILQDMGFLPLNCFIGFPRMNDVITPDTYVMQNKSNFKFLCQLAYEWHADFRTAHSRNGDMIALFAGNGYASLKDTFASMAAQAISGQSITLDYAYQTSLNTTLVRSYSYEQAGGGSGDNIQTVIQADGTVGFRRYITKTEKTLVYKYHPDKVEAALKNIQDPTEKAKKAQEWLAIENFDDIMNRPDTKGFFTLEHDTTAPQGVGFTVKCKTLGNPMLTVPMRVNFGKVDAFTREASKSALGWPDMLTSQDLGFRIRKVTHTITTAGYECDLDIADGFTLSGGALI